MKEIMALRDQYDDREMLAKLSDLGLTVEAAVEMRTQEQLDHTDLLDKDNANKPGMTGVQAQNRKKSVDAKPIDDFEWQRSPHGMFVWDPTEEVICKIEEN